MKTLLEYSKALGSLVFGLMVGVVAVIIAVPDYKLGSMFAQAVNQGDISMTLILDPSSETQLFSGSTVRYQLSIENLIIQGLGENYPDAEIHIIPGAGLTFDSINQDQFVINTTPTQQGSRTIFSYLDPLPRGSEPHTFVIDAIATQPGTHTMQVEIIHPASDNEANPYVTGCGASNNVGCVDVTIEEDLDPACNASLSSSSLYEDGQLTDATLIDLPACDEGSFGNPSPTPGNLSATDTSFVYECIVTGKTPVSCSVARRFCGDGTVDSNDGEACDGASIGGLECDSSTCQLVGCTDSLAYNYDSAATQDNGECRVMGDGIVDFADGEECDDGNTESGDGCSDVGQIEAGYSCPVGNQPCVDLDECQVQPGVCGSNSICENTVGSYTCTCENGFESDDGTNCVDIDECALHTDTCDTNATCTNTDGGYSCACNSGYTGDGETCADIDECALGTDLCDDAGTCSNEEGGYSCSCLPGYYNAISDTGDFGSFSTVNTCLEIDECTGQVENPNGGYMTISETPQLNQGSDCTAIGGVCSNEIGGTPGFSCDCPTGYQTDGQGICQIVYGDGIVVAGIEECDLGVLGQDDGCSDTGQFESPSCAIVGVPSTGTVGDIIQISLQGPLSARESGILLEWGDGSIEEDPTFPLSHAYTAGQQYTVTLTVSNILDETVMETCEAVVAIDTVCGNGVPEAGEACDAGSSNGIMCNTGYGESCSYCSDSCTVATVQGASCGDGIVDDAFEACDAGEENGTVCTGSPGTTCDYCSDTCELQEYTIPARSKGGTASSVSVRMTTTGTVTEQVHSSADKASQELQEMDGDNQEEESNDHEDDEIHAFVQGGEKSDTDESSGITLSKADLSVGELFMKPIHELTPESLSQILYAITRSNKEEIRTALMRYHEMKDSIQ